MGRAAVKIDQSTPERPLVLCRVALTKAGVTCATGHTGAVTLIQRFGSALNLNVHLHMIFVDGVYLTDG